MVVSADALLQPVSSRGDAARQRATASASGSLTREDRVETMLLEEE